MDPSANRPNFLIITTDQHNPTHFGYAGHPVVQTPNIDALAAQSTNFSRAYVTNPVCMPTRASLYTGLMPSGHRVRMNGIPLDWDVPTIFQSLADDGYATHVAGKIHLRPSGLPNGLDPADADPREHPESTLLWTSGRTRDLPSPYFGIQSADYVGGHGSGSTGHYLHWLHEEHPNEEHLFYDKVALEPPTPAFDQFNRTSFKWALPAELHPTAYIADKTIDYINTVGSRTDNSDASSPAEPFSLWCSIQDPHSPFAPPAPYCYKYNEEDVPPALFDADEFDRMPPHFRAQYETDLVTSGSNGQSMGATTPYRDECSAHYFGLIEQLDHHVGRVLKALRDNGLEDNTVVILTADHGDAMGDHGMWGKGPYHYDGVVRVPFLVRWPGKFGAGLKYEGVTSLVDFAPTILDIAGIPIPEGPTPEHTEAPGAPNAWPGRSLVPLLTGRNTSTDSTALIEDDQDYLGFRMRTLVTKRYRLTAYSGQPYGELFDFQEDPDEFRNLWDEPDYRSIRDELRIALLDKIMETGSPLPRQFSRS
jgi:arylsulfatase A-like enzyme